MKLNVKTSITLSTDESAILNATASRLGISRNEVMRHLILYQGMCGGDFPLTTQILALPPPSRLKVIGEIRRRCERGESAKVQAFREWIKEVLGDADEATIQKGTHAILQKLLNTRPGAEEKESQAP